MASSGGFKANFHLVGFKRSDPFATRLRQVRSIAARKKMIYKAMAKAGESMRDSMEAMSPVKTGVLSQSFSIRKLKQTPTFTFGIRIGAISGPRVVSPNKLGYISGVEAGDTYNAAGWRDHWAELGTVRHAAHPHVQPAIRKHLSTYNLRLRRALAEIFQTEFYRKAAKG